MSHLTDLELSMLADGALATDPLSSEKEAGSHLTDCDSCQSRLDSFVQERQLLSDSMDREEIVVPELVMPKFSRPITLRGFAMANVATGLILWFTQFLWKTLFGELIVNAVTELTAIYIPDAFEIFVNTALYISLEGTNMIENYFDLIIVSLVALSIGCGVIWFRSTRMLVSLSVVIAACTALVAPAPVSALEIRRDDNMVTVDASETVNDTLIIMSDTVIVDGEVKGDLVAMGRRIIVNGEVGGNLITLGKSISVSSSAGGAVISASETFEITDSTVAGDLWIAGSDVSIDSESSVQGNAIIATELAEIHGAIGRDVYAFGESIELSGSIGEDFEVFAGDVRLFGDASVAGDLRARLDDEDDLQRSSSSTVKGQVEFVSLPEEFEPANRYVTGDFYLGQLFRLASAFLVGVMLLWLVPLVRDESLAGGTEGLKTAGIGLLALISTPIVLILCMATVVGIPVALIGLAAWGVAVYLSKIMIAAMVGQMLLNATSLEDNLFAIMAAGLVIVVVATALPAIGGILNFILTIVGLGMIVQMLMANLREASVG